MSSIYPKLSSLIPITKIPTELGPIQGGLQAIFSQLHYNKIEFSRSRRCDYGHYKMTLVSQSHIGLEVGGVNGIALILNPGTIPNTGSEIEIEIAYSIPILRYIDINRLSAFAQGPDEWFQLLFDMIGINEEQFLDGILGAIFPHSPDPLGEFLTLFNSQSGYSGPALVVGVHTHLSVFGDILKQIKDNGVGFLTFVFDTFVDTGVTVQDKMDNLKTLFKGWFGDIDFSQLLQEFLPVVVAVMKDMSIALEFPRTLLIPLNAAGKPADSPAKSMLEFTVGDLIFTTEAGFELVENSNFNFTKSEIPGLGITVDMQNAMLDISETKNIHPAMLDGRPLTFKGCYVEELTVEFPAFWEPQQGNAHTAMVVGTNLLCGNPGGISGDFELENLPNQQNGVLNFTITGAFELSINSFSLSLRKNAVTNSNIAGTLNFPGLQSNGNPTNFNFLVSIGNDITTAAKKYIVEVQSPPPVSLGDISVDFNHLKVGFDDNGIVPADTAIDGAITFPLLTNSNGQPEQMGFDLVINNPNGLSTYTVTVSNPPTLKLFGVEVDFSQVQFTFNANGIQNPTNISGNIYFPGTDDNNGNDVPMAFIMEVDNINKRYFFNVANVPTIYVLGVELDVNAFQIVFDNTGIYTANIDGTLLIPGTDDGNGGNQPINFDLAVNTGNGVKSFSANATNLPLLHLGLFELDFNNIGFTFDDTGILSSNIAGNILFPGMTGQPIGFTMNIGNGTYSVSVTNPPALTLGPATIQFNDFTLSWDENGFVTPFAVTGNLEIEGLEDSNGNTQAIGFGFEVVNGVYKLTASNVPPLYIGDFALTVQSFAIEFDKNGITSGALNGYLEIDGFADNTNDPAQIGMTIQINQDGFLVQADVQGVNTELEIPDVLRVEVLTAWVEKNLSIWKAGFTGQFDLLLEIPALDKVLPETIFVDDFSIDTAGNTELDLRLKWKGEDEIVPDTSAGLSIYIPVNKTILNFITISGIDLTATDTNPGLKLESRLDNTTFKLGPIAAVVEGLGMEADITFPANGGNLGPLQADLGVIWPTGIGLSIDAVAVKGAGFISFDQDKGRYVGALELTIKDLISVKAVGVLSTRLPDGSKTFSLLLLISAEFPPIQLGFGFTLNGVGGLVGIHRTMRPEVLRRGVKNNTLDNIMFPTNPVENIHQIVSDLEEVFPMKQDHYSFGLMGIIGWGTPTLIAIEMGLMIEVPDPVRIAILGVVKALLPDENKALLKLQVNFLGTIDFEKKLLTFDASLYDSRLLNFTLAGDMAMRMKWGDNPGFLFTVGGFHPDFDPPPLALPSLQRLTVNLLGGNNPRLTLKSYFAVTSNTVQFGSRVEFYYRVSNKIRVEGFLGFDALFQFSPFYFSIQFAASLAVYWKQKVLLSIYLKVLLEGPAPWHAMGKAEFKILGFKCKVNFDKRWGNPENTTLPNIPVLPKLKAAVEADGNWQAIQPDNKVRGVTLRKAESQNGKLLAQPETIFGIHQKVVPLGVTIGKFSNQRPSDHKRFDLKIYEGSDNLTGASTKEYFAANDFFWLSNSQKVSRPSFEQFNSGKKATLPGGQELTGDLFREKELVYDRLLMDARNDPQTLPPDPESSARYNAGVRNGATARSTHAAKAKGKSARAPKRVAVRGATYGVARISTMAHYENLSAASAAEARQLVADAILANPELENDLQVVPLFELA